MSNGFCLFGLLAFFFGGFEIFYSGWFTALTSFVAVCIEIGAFATWSQAIIRIVGQIDEIVY